MKTYFYYDSVMFSFRKQVFWVDMHINILNIMENGNQVKWTICCRYVNTCNCHFTYIEFYWSVFLFNVNCYMISGSDTRVGAGCWGNDVQFGAITNVPTAQRRGVRYRNEESFVPREPCF